MLNPFKITILWDSFQTIYSFSFFLSRSQETPGDGQPPALPPKQSKKNSWNQIHYSQQDLENHINEPFDVPSSPEKSTVSSIKYSRISLKFLNHKWYFFCTAACFIYKLYYCAFSFHHIFAHELCHNVIQLWNFLLLSFIKCSLL